jgi:hypothetical protein
MKTATMFSAIINEASQVLSVRSWIEVFIAVHVDEENQAKKSNFYAPHNADGKSCHAR